MKPKNLILRLLEGHRVMALATNRPDGWPQVTMVGYINDGFLIYCVIAANTQKHTNILRDPRVSIAIGSDSARPSEIQGLSLAGTASIVTDPREVEYVSQLRLKRYPEYAALTVAPDGPAARIAPRPEPAAVVVLSITPELFSVLDYSKGFGHSDLVTFSERDLDLHLDSRRHRWDASMVREDGDDTA